MEERALARVAGILTLIGGLVFAQSAPPSAGGTGDVVPYRLDASAASENPAAWLRTLPVRQQSLQVLSAFRDGTGYVQDKGGGDMALWRTTDYGLTWSALTQLPPEASGFLQIRFATPKRGFAVDFDRLWRTEAGATLGSGWQRLPGPRLPRGRYFRADSELHGLAVTGHTVAFAGGVYRSPNPADCRQVSHNVWTSHNDGRQWITARLPSNAYALDFRYLNDRIGVLIAYTLTPDPQNKCGSAGLTNALFVTRDGGRHFTRVLSCAAKTGQLCMAARFASPNVLIAGRNDGTTVISTDGGRHFRPGQTLSPVTGYTHACPNLIGISCLDNTSWVQGFSFSGRLGYATSKSGGAWRTTDGGRHWTREPSCDSTLGLGFGEAAAFDTTRAIAGGPNCVATRVSTPDAPAASPPPPGSMPGRVWTATADGRTISVLQGGGLLVTRSSS